MTSALSRPVLELASARPGARAPTVIVPEIQALRALAVAGVVVYHLWPSLLPAGFVGVDVFFVISGYLITSHMIGEVERTGRLGLARFYARRARRILPAATLVVVSTVLATLVLLPELRWTEVTRQGTASLLWVQNWLLASDSVDYLAEGAAPSPFQHFWSLSIEEQFYVVWPVLLVLLLWGQRRVARRRQRGAAGARRSALVLVLVLTVASFACSVVVTASGDPAAYFVSHTRFWELGLGALLALSALRAADGRVRAVIAWLGIVLIVGGMVLVPVEGFPGALALVPTVGAVLVILAARSGGTPTVRQLSSGRAVLWLGDTSYSLYLWHWPLLVLAPTAVARFGGGPAAPEAATSVLLVVLGLSLVLAGLTRRLVELPFHRGLAPGAGARTVLGASAVALVVSVALVQVPGRLADARADERAAGASALLAEAPEALGAGSLTAGGVDTFATDSRTIVPAPENPREELPEGAEGRCKAARDGEGAAPRCEFGPADAEVVVALVGDSHAEQYLPALQEVAPQHGVRVVTYLRSSCPYSTAQPVSDAERGGLCLRSNEVTTEALLADDTVDVVVTSNRTDGDFVADGLASPVDGLVEAWTRLTDAGLPVVVLSDTPQMLPEDATTECVITHADDPSVCARSASQALPVDHQIAAAADASAEGAGVTLVDTQPWFCVDGTCPPVIGSVLVYRDDHHITPAYSRTLAPLLWESLAGAFDGGRERESAGVADVP